MNPTKLDRQAVAGLFFDASRHAERGEFDLGTVCLPAEQLAAVGNLLLYGSGITSLASEALEPFVTLGEEIKTKSEEQGFPPWFGCRNHPVTGWKNALKWEDYARAKEALGALKSQAWLELKPISADALADYVHRQMEWAAVTFGPGSRAGALTAHIRKEADEIAADPGDPKEWIDVITLALEGFCRNGGSPETVLPMLQATFERNAARTWPDWRQVPEGQAIEHDRTGETENSDRREAAALHPEALPLEQWHEDRGDALWWRFPIVEPPYCGSPLASDWPGYHTHFTPILLPKGFAK